MDILQAIAASVVEGKVDEVAALTEQAVQQHIAIQKIMDEGYMSGLKTVGEKYTAGELFLPEMLVAGMAVSAGLEVVRPLFAGSSLKPKGTIVAGTVEGDTTSGRTSSA
jgi:5-methyltetrahydrofolate--homocysteine methyltransferase